MAETEVNDKTITVPDNWQRWRTPLLVLAAVLIAVVVFGTGVVAGRNHVIGPGKSIVAQRFMGGGPGGSRGFGGGRRFIGGANAQNRVMGVVTAVSGSTITVAGGGSTNTVTTNSSTHYSGGSAPGVNDTIVAIGNISNDTFTATQILINPGAGSG